MEIDQGHDPVDGIWDGPDNPPDGWPHPDGDDSRPDEAEAQLQTFNGITCEATNTKNRQSGGGNLKP